MSYELMLMWTIAENRRRALETDFRHTGSLIPASRRGRGLLSRVLRPLFCRHPAVFAVAEGRRPLDATG